MRNHAERGPEPSAPSSPEGAGVRTPATELLAAWRAGDASAGDRLMTVVYDELRRLAGRAMRKEQADHTLQPTALVNEAYLQLIRADVSYRDRTHFYAMAARVMRHVLVDHARRKGRQKRGGDVARVTLEEGLVAGDEPQADLLALDDALERLAAHQPRKARVIELFYFGGLTAEEVAEVVDVSVATVNRDLRMARAWLYDALH